MMEDDRALATEKLTDKMEAFAQAYVDPANTASDAYRLAYNAENMGVQTVSNEAGALAKKPKVARRIQELRDALQERALVTKTDILLELKGIGFGNLTNLRN